MLNEQQREIEALVHLLNQHQLTELEIEKDGVRIRVRRERTTLVSVDPAVESLSGTEPIPAPVEAPSVPAEHSRFVTVTSPIVGTFYRSPAPDADPFVEEGEFVKKGQTLCIVEAMKLMNDIEAETDGRIVKVLLDSATPVEYGQALFLIDPVAG